MTGTWSTVFNCVQHARLKISRKRPTDTYLAAIADLCASQYPSATRCETSTWCEKKCRRWYRNPRWVSTPRTFKEQLSLVRISTLLAGQGQDRRWNSLNFALANAAWEIHGNPKTNTKDSKDIERTETFNWWAFPIGFDVPLDFWAKTKASFSATGHRPDLQLGMESRWMVVSRAQDFARIPKKWVVHPQKINMEPGNDGFQ